jgi:hypothetical protein
VTAALEVNIQPRQYVTIKRHAACAVCATSGERCQLERHHVFGRTAPVVMRVCSQCHTQYHRELDTGKPGTAVVAMLEAAAEAFRQYALVGEQ